MLTDSNAREHHSLGGCAWYRVVVFARDCRASCSRGTGRTAHVESVGVIAKIRCQQLERRRQVLAVPPPLAVALPEQVKQRDIPVQPHDLAGYDALMENRNDHA